MVLIKLFLFLLHITNQLPDNYSRFSQFSLLPINYQASSFTITILPRTFPESSLYEYLHRTYNHTLNPPSEEELNELKKWSTSVNRYGQTSEEEAAGWFPGLYPYLPSCLKDKKCSAIILWFTPEQLEKDDEEVFDYIYEKELGQSKAVSHVEKAIHDNGDKLIIATLDERRVLQELYTDLAENKSTILGVICPLGFAWGLVMIFFGRKVMRFIGFVTGFAFTTLIVNFWGYPARLSEFYTHQLDADFYWNLALVLGSGLPAGFLASKSDKIAVCVFYGLIGTVVGGYVLLHTLIFLLLSLLGSGRAFCLFMFGLEAYLLYKVTKFVLKHYQRASAVATSLFGGIFVSLSIFLCFGLRITKQGIVMGGLGTRINSLLMYLAVFLTWYGMKRQLERERIRRLPKDKKAEGKKKYSGSEGFRNYWRDYAEAENNNSPVNN